MENLSELIEIKNIILEIQKDFLQRGKATCIEKENILLMNTTDYLKEQRKFSTAISAERNYL